MTLDDSLRRQIEQYVAAYNAFDVPGMLTLMHPEITFQNITGGKVTAEAHGINELRELAERAVKLFASRRQTIRHYARDGSGATIEIDYEGVLATDLGPGLRAGDTLRLAGRSTFQFKDGLIVKLIDES